MEVVLIETKTSISGKRSLPRGDGFELQASELNDLWKKAVDLSGPTAGNAHLLYARMIEWHYDIQPKKRPQSSS